jgi:acetoin:2,6-dichlorophenolindophenol oxidoreductase subunit alpha
MQLPSDKRRWMYATMVKSRYYEACIRDAYMEGKRPVFNMANGPMPGEMHLADGQEPCAVGLAAHLGPEDFVACHHRSHAQAIAKGVDLKRMTAEIFGRRSGLAGGRGGHMHLFDEKVLFWTSGIIGQNVGPAAGAALARVMRGERGIGVAVIGEGGANQGGFHEGLNLAALWKLPFICVIEDNKWAVSVPKAKSTAVPRNDVRGAAYGIPGEYVEGNDPDAIAEAFGRAVARARAGGGPTLLELETVRLQGHFMGDPEGYRPKEEIEGKPGADPIPRYRDKLLSEGVLSAQADEQLVARAKAEVDEAFAFARAAAEPRPEEALEHVFVA